MTDRPKRPLDSAALRQVPPASAAEELARARLRQALFDRRSEPARIGRYRVLAKLGAGSHGIVYAAHDERLDRKVALKVLRPDVTHPRAKDRLLREAQALARLAHPNIVTVHEVFEDEGGEVVVVMELVEGPSLDRWVRDARPSAAEILAVYRQAGEGLAAAHGVGVVHRDFKPANAILGRQIGSEANDAGAARVRVLDFGLARLGTHAIADGSHDERPAEIVPAAGAFGDHTLPEAIGDSHDAPAGAPTAGTGVVGTPRYMPPEQHRGSPADERSDQYSFCVALREALHGRPPFEGDTMPALYRAKTSGSPPRMEGVALPARILRAIDRGLDPDPRARHPSMRALLDALAHDPRARRRRWAGALAITTAAAALVHASTEAGDPCSDAGHDATAVWNDARAEHLAEVFRSTGAPWAEDAWRSTRGAIDRFAEGWIDARVQACESHARGEQSAELFDLRSACLDRRLDHLTGLLSVLEQADGDVVAEATAAASRLPSLEGCSNARALRAVAPLPGDPQLAARIAALREELALAKANIEAGRLEIGLELSDAVLADPASEHAPLRAEARATRGDALSMLGRTEEAASELREAALLATRIGDDALFARIAASLAWEHGEVDDAYELAHTWVDLGRAAIDHMGGDREAAATLHNAKGAILSNQGELDAALVEHRARLELVGEDSFAAHHSLTNIGNVHNRRGEFETARRFYDRAAALLERELGPDHPRVLALHTNVLGILWRTEPLEQAAARGRELLERQERVLGPDHPMLTATLTNLALIENTRGDRAEAERVGRRAVELLERVYGEDSRFLPAALGQLAQSVAAQDRLPEARALAERALRISRAATGEQSLEVAHAEQVLAQLAAQAGDADAQAQHLSRMRTAAETAGGTSHPLVAIADSMNAELAREEGRLDEALTLATSAASVLDAAGPGHRLDAAIARHHRGQILVELQRFEEARDVLEEADAELDALGIDGDRRARVLFALARALHGLGDAKQAAERAQQAAKAAEDPELRAEIASARLSEAPDRSRP